MGASEFSALFMLIIEPDGRYRLSRLQKPAQRRVGSHSLITILHSALHATKVGCKSLAAVLPGAQACLPLAVRTCWLTAVSSLELRSQAGSEGSRAPSRNKW